MRKFIWLATLALTIALYSYWTKTQTQTQNSAKNGESASPLQVNPAQSLDSPNEKISSATLEELEKMALNVEEQGDTRAEAIEKLSRLPDDHVLETLTQLAARNLPKSGGGLFVAQERVFAAMAIEGILNHPSKEQQRKSIEAILKTQSDQFIVTRANMALGFIKGVTPHPKDVDEKNLTNLFQ